MMTLFLPSFLFFFFFTATATTEIYTLSLHDALPISMLLFRSEEHVARWCRIWKLRRGAVFSLQQGLRLAKACWSEKTADRKSTRLNSSHPSISYAVFCLKKKKKTYRI